MAAISSGWSRHPDYPSFDLRHGTFRRRQVGLEERGEATILVGTREPSANAVSVVLVARPIRAGEAAAPERGIDLGNDGTSRGNVPAIERPEMHSIAQPLTDEAQPWNPRMGGFRYRTLHVEMKHRFCATSAFLSQAPPSGVAPARGSIPHRTNTDKIDVDILVGRPVALKIFEERRPVRLEAVQSDSSQCVLLYSASEPFRKPM